MINYLENEKKQFESVMQLIERLVEDIIQIYDIEVPIKDIKGVVEKLGGNVTESSEKPAGVYKTTHGFLIVYPPHIKDIKKIKFRLVQEIGHLFLHMRYSIDEDYWNNLPTGYCLQTAQVCEEYQANMFAEAFLLPRKAYTEKLKVYKDTKIDFNDLAEYFGVASRLASDRAKHLKLIKRQDWSNTFE